MDTRHVLVLGGTGFLGSCVVRELNRRLLRTAVLSRRHGTKESLASGPTLFFAGDCNDPASLQRAMANCRAVIHCAGYYPVYSIGRGNQSAQAVRELRNVLAASYRRGVERFIFTSSPMVLANNPEVFRRCTYHQIKKLLHDEVFRWADRGLPAVLAIPGACFGPGDHKPTAGRIILEIARGRLRFIVEGMMNAVDARDVAAAEVELLERGAAGESYQLGNWNCLFSEFSALVAQLSDVPAPALHVPYHAARLAAAIIESAQYALGIPSPFFPVSGVEQIHFGTGLDSTLARRELGFTTRPIEQTIADTLHYFASIGLLGHISSSSSGPALFPRGT